MGRRLRGVAGLAMLMIATMTAASAATHPTPCADPAADIQAVLVSRTGLDTGRVRITGQIKNLGPESWIATSRQHRLRMELVMVPSPAHPNGELVEPPIDITQLDAGGQYRIDHQLNWRVSKGATYPRFLIRFTEMGKPAQPSSRADCRSDNNRKEITPTEINHLFGAASASGIPLKIIDYRLLGGQGINTVETVLAYDRNSPSAGRITASVAAPYNGLADEAPIAGNSGKIAMRVHVPCDKDAATVLSAPLVSITYRLWGQVSVSGVPSWMASYRLEQSIPYKELCPTKPGANKKPSQ